ETIATDDLFGLVRGFQQPDVTTARAALQPLLLAYGCDVVERDGTLRFRNRTGRVTAEIDGDDLVILSDLDGSFETTRAADVETAGQVRLGYVDAQSSFEIRAAEARFPDEEARGVSQSDLPLALTRSEGLAVVERWLAEARVARDGARFALPKSRLSVGAGDVVRKAGLRYRIDRVEGAEAQLLEAVRVEPGVYQPSDSDGEAITARSFVPPVPVTPVFLDLPLLTGEEVPYAPHVAVAAEPWPGSVAVWSSSQDQGYEVNRLIAGSAVIGVTEAPLLRASPGVWDRGAPLRIRISDGELASADTLAVLNGANAMAIGDGSAANWEVFQFADAQIVAPDTYELSTRLRGQLGTDAVMPEVWPVGSTVVLLDLALSQIDLPLSARGLARYYRIGIAARGLDDPNVTTLVEAFDGVGLRPYSVAHLR
ncbi:MAG: host specificity protein, partial [Rhodobacterales bacterium 17-64-5]